VTALASGVQRAFEAELLALVPSHPAGEIPPPGSEQRAHEGAAGASATELSSSKADSLLSLAMALREKLGTLLGDRLDMAYFRLLAAALSDGADDESLASGGMHELLGDATQEALPLLLKLIFVETRTRAAQVPPRF